MKIQFKSDRGEDSLINPWLDQVSSKHTATKFAVLSIIFAAVVMVYPNDFSFTPSRFTGQLLLIQFVYLGGWLLLVFGAQVVGIRAIWDANPTWIQILILGAIRPISLILIQVNVYSSTGSLSLGYLTARPLFLLTDVVIPGFLIYLAFRERSNQRLVPLS